jgi:hypothetical protein
VSHREGHGPGAISKVEPAEEAGVGAAAGRRWTGAVGPTGWSVPGAAEPRSAQAQLALACPSATAQTRPQQARIAFGVPHVEL